MKRYVQTLLTDCHTEISDIKHFISHNQFHSTVPYLTGYAVIRACGTIEVSYKSIIADFFLRTRNTQIKNYIDNQVRNNSMNPSYDNMCKLLLKFDNNWNANFKRQVTADPDSSRLLTSLKSLNDARNQLAHGGRPTTTIQSLEGYYLDATQILRILDSVVR